MYEYRLPFAKKHVAEGLRQGRLEQGAQAVLAVLDARGLDIPEAVRQRISSSEDIAALDRWLRRAIVVKSALELFEERGPDVSA